MKKALLMMGNLAPGLKSHAVTMYEVGKLADESLDDFLNELSKVNEQSEGGINQIKKKKSRNSQFG